MLVLLERMAKSSMCRGRKLRTGLRWPWDDLQNDKSTQRRVVKNQERCHLAGFQQPTYMVSVNVNVEENAYLDRVANVVHMLIGRTRTKDMSTSVGTDWI